LPESSTRRKLITVTGSIDPAEAGITDAHNHVWIAPVAGATDDAPVLNDQSAITQELIAYRNGGGGTVIDCQPGGCGRDGRILRQLAEASGVNIVACTGFHLRKYYPAGFSLFESSPETACQHFVAELGEQLEESQDLVVPIRAGFIKIACEDTLEKSPMNLLEGAVLASLETGAAIEVHTEQGAGAERIVQTMLDFGLTPDRLILCHVDKRPDFAFHANLAQMGIMLAYDTFYRPKYRPDEHVWPLLERMVEAGYAAQISIATDMADAAMWSSMGQGPGLTGLITQIAARLEMMNFDKQTVHNLTGQNIAHRLALLG
jgi:predicted metal-dependent phosphotriesterase family hydrolase